MKKIIKSLLIVICMFIFTACANDTKSTNLEVSHGVYKFHLDQEIVLENIIKYKSSKALNYEKNVDTDEYYLLKNPKGNIDLDNKVFDVLISLDPSGNLKDIEDEMYANNNLKDITSESRVINDINWNYYSYIENREEIKDEFLTHAYYLEKESNGIVYLIKILFLKVDNSKTTNDVKKFEDELIKSFTFVD